MDSKDLLGLLAQGVVLGFSIAAPVGPIGVLCIRRTLQHGFKSGLASGLGAASAVAVYGAIAAVGWSLRIDTLAVTWISSRATGRGAISTRTSTVWPAVTVRVSTALVEKPSPLTSRE